MKELRLKINDVVHIVSGKADVDIVDETIRIVVLEKGTVIEEVGSSNQKIGIVLKDNTSLDYIAVQSGKGIVVSRTAEVGKHATVRWFDINLMSGEAKTSTVTKLVGEGARGETYGVFFASGDERYAVSHTTEHIASRTSSDMKTRGVVGGTAFVDYTGLVRVPEGSYGCEGYQQEDTLLLSKDAKIHAVPDLEIANNDVKCSHGVTTTHMSREKLFYMNSRGLDRATAEQLVVRAHLAGVLDQLSEQKKEAVFALIDEKFERTPSLV